MFVRASINAKGLPLKLFVKKNELSKKKQKKNTSFINIIANLACFFF